MVRAENKGDEEQPKLTRKKEAETEASHKSLISRGEKRGESFERSNGDNRHRGDNRRPGVDFTRRRDERVHRTMRY